MRNPFTPASKRDKKLKMLLYGAAGVGKTTLALQIPVDGKIALIDMEGGADLYADADGLPDFDVLRTKTYEDVERALAFISQAKHEYDLLILDPITVLWNVIIDGVSRRGDSAVTQREWGIIKRKMNRIYDAIVNLPTNVIVTARAKDDYKNDELVGQKPDAEKGLTFLFDIVLRLGIDPETGKRGAAVDKDRSNTLPRYVPDITPDTFAPILGKVSGGEDATQQTEEEAAENFANQIESESHNAPESRENGHQQKKSSSRRNRAAPRSSDAPRKMTDVKAAMITQAARTKQKIEQNGEEDTIIDEDAAIRLGRQAGILFSQVGYDALRLPFLSWMYDREIKSVKGLYRSEAAGFLLAFVQDARAPKEIEKFAEYLDAKSMPDPSAEDTGELPTDPDTAPDEFDTFNAEQDQEEAA